MLVEYITGITFNNYLFSLWHSRYSWLSTQQASPWSHYCLFTIRHSLCKFLPTWPKEAINNSLIKYIWNIYYWYSGCIFNYSCHTNKFTSCSTSTTSTLSVLVIGVQRHFQSHCCCIVRLSCLWRTLSPYQTLFYKFISCVPNHRRGNKMKNVLYHTVRTVPKSNRKIIEITRKTYTTTVRTVPKSFRKIIEVKGKIPHCQNSS